MGIQHSIMQRREMIANIGWSLASVALTGTLLSSLRKNSARSILLVSGWQTVNIGDIAHTPGMIHLLNTYLPDVRITLWPNDISIVEEKMLLSNFPALKIVYGKLNQNGLPDTEEVHKALLENDFLLHGSGPGIVGQSKLEAWKKATGKPFGVFGVTITSVPPGLKELLNGASFIFTRETASLKVLSDAGITQPLTGFAPDATFFMPVRNDASAEAFMRTRKLEDRKFICMAPRSRYTPYHRIHDLNSWDVEKIRQVINDNLKYAETDHEKLRHVIIRWVTETGNKVVLVPEMEYQTELYEPYLYNPLPEEIKQNVEMHPYWQPDEAASLYARAAAVISMECHSPIISLVNGTPAFYVRQPSDTIKGQMYYDLRLEDWVFEIEETRGEDIAKSLMEVYHGYNLALNKVKALNQRIRKIYDYSMDKVSAIGFRSMKNY